MTDFDFTRREGEELTLETAVFEALGAASMCWDETPTGIFDSTRAKAIGERLVEFIKGWESTGLRVQKRRSVAGEAWWGVLDNERGLFAPLDAETIADDIRNQLERGQLHQDALAWVSVELYPTIEAR